MQKAEQDVVVMSEQGAVKYPSGVQSWRGPVEFLEVDQQLEASRSSDH